MSYLAIDPGLDTGWAVWLAKGRLLRCGVGDPLDGQAALNRATEGAVKVASVVIECPQVYNPRMSKGDPNNLIKLARQVGRYEERFESRGARVGTILPHDWKGTMPKEICHARAYADLSLDERQIVDACGRNVAPSKRHNMLDAVALGQWAFAHRRWLDVEVRAV